MARRRLTPIVKIALEIAAGAVAIVAAVALVLAFHLARGPVSLEPVAGGLEAALERAWPSMTLSFEDAYLIWDGEARDLRLELRQLTVADLIGGEAARFPLVEISVSRRALARGVIAPTEIALAGATAELTRAADGTLSMGLTGPGEAAAGEDEGDGFSAMVARLLTDHDPASPLGYFKSLTIDEARFVYRDEPRDLVVEAPQAALSLTRTDAGAAFSLDALVAWEAQSVGVEIEGVYDAQSRLSDLDVTFTSVPFAEIARLGGRFTALEELRGEVSGTLGLSVGAEGEIAGARAHLIASDVRQRFGNPFHRALTLDTLALQARYDGGRQAVTLERVSYQSRQNEGSWTGQIVYTPPENGLVPSEASWELVGEDLRLWLPVFSERPAGVDRLNASGRLDLGAGLLSLETLEAAAGEARFRFDGLVDWSDPAGLAADLTGTLSDFAVNDLMAFWPSGFVPGARDWFSSYARNGRFTEANLVIDAPPGALALEPMPNEVLDFRFAFEGLEIDYVPGLTPMRQTQGEGRLQGNRFEVSVSRGRIGDITVLSGRMLTEDFHIRGSPGLFAGEAVGPTRQLVGLMDMGPFGYPSEYGFDVDTLTGTGRASLEISLPLRRYVTLEQIDFSVRGMVEGLDMAEVQPGVDLTGISMEVGVNRSGILGTGRGLLNEAPVSLRWEEDFAGGDMPSYFRVDAVVDDAARARLGLDTGGMLIGPVSLALETRGRGLDIREIDLRADLSAAAVNVGEAWRKPADAPAAGRIRLTLPQEGGYDAEEILIVADDIHVRGQAALAADGRLVSADFSRLKLAGLADLTFRAGRGEGERLEARLEGGLLDLGPLLETWRLDGEAGPGGAADEPGRPIHVAGTLALLRLRNGVELTDVTLDAHHDGLGVSEFQVTGAFSREARMHAVLEPSPRGRSFRLVSGDGGAVIAGLSGVTGLSGGALEVAAEMPPTGPAPAASPPRQIKGDVTMTDFQVRDIPFLARILMLGSFQGITDLLQGDGIRFAELKLPLAISDEAIIFEPSHARGQTLGLTLQGRLDRLADTADLSGTIVPAYAINAALGGVPVLGDILVGREGEGIIGVTYEIRGEMEDPRIVVNPLSALAPGLLRRLFEGSAPAVARENPANTPNPPLEESVNPR